MLSVGSFYLHLNMYVKSSLCNAFLKRHFHDDEHLQLPDDINVIYVFVPPIFTSHFLSK